MMSACTRRDYRSRLGMYSRVTWTTLALLFLCVALSEHGCEVSADSEVDSDLVFDLDDPVVRDLESSSHKQDHRKFEKRNAKALLEKSLFSSAEHHEEEESHWLTKAVHRIKRGLFDWFEPKKKEDQDQVTEETVDSREKRSSKEEGQQLFTEEYDTAGHSHDDQHEFDEDGPGININEANFSNEDLPAYRPPNHHATDDEDLDNEISGSGTDEPIPKGPYYYRITFAVREPYQQDFEQTSSRAFKGFAKQLGDAIDQLYANDPGRQSATVIKIQQRPSDSFTSLVTVDLGTMDYYDTAAIRHRLYEQIQNYQRLGSVPVGTEEFSFRKFEVDVRPESACESDQLKCRDSGECLPGEYRCNGVSECVDGSDEMGCPAIPDITVVTPSGGIDTIETSTLTPNGVPVPIPNPRDRCRADDAVRCRGSSVYICKVQECDGKEDCPGGEDELDCPEEECATGEFMCDVTRCIPENKICDGTPDCADKTDEQACPDICKDSQFRCIDGSCIDESQRCDRRSDCPDGEDEHNCHGRNCNSTTEFTCEDGTCIPISLKCNRKYDCPKGDVSDEPRNCPCHRDDFYCSPGVCIAPDRRCNGITDCNNMADEKNCTHSACSKFEYTCADGSCIHLNRKCDGRNDCPDGSDEWEYECATCQEDDIRCEDGTCIPKSSRCDNIFDCVDGVDEQNCTLCAPDQYRCNNGECIDENRRCDGFPQCNDRSDEENCQCLPNQFRCDNGACISQDFRCDDYDDCIDGSDERNCPKKCGGDEFRCPDNSCIPVNRKCDGRRDCYDGSDEHNCPQTCPSYEFNCGDGHCLSRDLVCDRKMDCRDGRDEENCGCNYDQFTCLSGECILKSLKCDGHADCYDSSDEENCPPPTNRPPPAETCTPGQWKCHSGECIPSSAYCDSHVDCNDYSDENNCHNKTGLNLKTYPDEQIIKESREVVFQCRDEGPLRARVRWVRGNSQPLPPGSRDINGRLEMPDIQVEHTGNYICQAIGYPPNTPGSSITVSLTVEPFEHPATRPPVACGLHEATCSNGDCIPKNLVCDGNFDCTDGSDETRCKQHGCEPNEFRCANKRCVLKTWRCDSDDDCGDNSDEENCATNPPGSPCRYNEFQCRSGNQCIPRSFHCDLERDCVDGSDEVGCSSVFIQKAPPPMVTLDPGAIFEITCTAVGVPTPEVVWRWNWGHIPEKCTTKSVGGVGTLTCPNIQEHDKGAYSCEAINIRGSVFAIPDTILVIKKGGKVCPLGFFNEEANHPSDCIKCFCFGVTSDCESADLFTYQLHPPLDVHKVVGVRVEPNGAVEVRDEPIYRGAQPDIRAIGRNGLSFRTSPYSSVENNVVPYFAMPENYNGNQLKSYGGYLKYKIRFSGPREPNNAPDIILKGNGYTLLHVGRPLQPEREHNVSARFFAGEWVKKGEGVREQIATREEIMMALASVDHVLIKLQYHHGPQINTTVSNIEMDSAAVRNTGLGRAAFVEECRCPVGYTGLSCENCAAGYVRHMSGPWLGKCYKEEEKCQPGYYGDPSRGIPCETCPCPLTNPSNQFARTCSLGPDGLVTCDCPPGYVGRRCEQCAAGYSGNPLIPGDSCKAGVCDAVGAHSTQPDQYGQCPCKLYTHGPTCNQCKPNTFNLGPDNQFGCIACFCMGITKQCTSSNWYRDQISTAFTRSRLDFKLVESLKKKEYIEDGIRIDSQAREIVYDEFSRRRPDVYYWSLPSRYLGDKVFSYGGNLKYTLRYVPAPGGLSSRNTAPDVELISANDITLLYFGKDQPQPNNAQSFSVPLLEQHWQRSDGQKTDREHLLMALADLEAILIKATYTTNTREAALISVSLDVADERNTGSLVRALPVEQCMCPKGYRGLSCEDCDVGYTRSDEGLYLGLCEECNCNGHSC